MKNVDIIINILKDNGGELRLREIQDLFCKIKNVTFNDGTRCTVTRTIEDYCLDYRDGGRGGNIFYKRKEGGKCYIGLKECLYTLEDIEIKEIEQDLEQYKEGQTNKVIVSNKTVRNPKLRRDYLNHLQKEDKLQCEICGEYKGDKEMLDVHHILEISNYSEMNKTYSTFSDVIAICPCCHRKIHLGRIDIKSYKIN